MSLFNARAQPIFLTSGQGLRDRRGIEQHPVLPVTVTVDLAIDHRMDRHRGSAQRSQVHHPATSLCAGRSVAATTDSESASPPFVEELRLVVGTRAFSAVSHHSYWWDVMTRGGESRSRKQLAFDKK